MSARALTTTGDHCPTPSSILDTGDRLVLRVLTIDLLLVVMTQKVAFPLASRETQVTAAMMIHFACLVYLGMHGRLRIPVARLVLFCAFATLAAVSQLSQASRSFSLPSMILMLSISAMLVVVTPVSPAGYRRMLDRFVLVALGAAALVGVDWGFQAVGLRMPDLEALIPHQLVYFEYNYIQPLEWGSRWMKPNGLFFLETSHVSQFIGLGLLVELTVFRRLRVVVALGAALLATFGVTGMLLVASSVPFLLARARSAVIVAVVTATPFVGLIAYQAGALDNFLRRTNEFSESSSSGYNRFVLPFEWSLASLTGPAEKAWLGSGAGSMPKDLNNEDTGTAGYAWPPYTKVGVEYGLLVFAVWLSFISRSLTGAGIPIVISWAAFAQYNFLNGSLNVPIHTIYCVLLCAGYAVGPQRLDRSSQNFPEIRRSSSATPQMRLSSSSIA